MSSAVNSSSGEAAQPIENKNNTRDHIIDCAIDLFSQYGYEVVSLRDLAREVGLKPPSLYNHFKNRESILVAIFEELESLFASDRRPDHAQAKELNNVSLEEALALDFNAFLEFWNQPGHLRIRSVITMEQHRNTRAAAFVLQETDRFLAATRTIFSALKEKGEIDDFDVDALAGSYTYAMLGMHRELRLRVLDGRDVDELLDRMRDFITFFSKLSGYSEGGQLCMF